MAMNELTNIESKEKQQLQGKKTETEESSAKGNAEGEKDGNPNESVSGESNAAVPNSGQPGRRVRSEYECLFHAVIFYSSVYGLQKCIKKKVKPHLSTLKRTGDTGGPNYFLALLFSAFYWGFSF